MDTPAKLKNFTPISDSLASELGLIQAAVYGRVWRFCEGRLNACTASTETISEALGIDRSTAYRAIKALCQSEYLEDLTPDADHVAHQYRVTDKYQMRIELSVDVGNSEPRPKKTVAHCTPLLHTATDLAQTVAHCTQRDIENKENVIFVPPLELRTLTVGAGPFGGNGGAVRKEQLASDKVARAAAKAEAKAALDAMDGRVREALTAFQSGISNGGKVKPLLPQTIEKDGKVIRDMLQAGYTPEQIGEAAKWLREKWPAVYKVSPIKLAENIHEWDEDGSSGQGQGQRYVPFEVVN